MNIYSNFLLDIFNAVLNQLPTIMTISPRGKIRLISKTVMIEVIIKIKIEIMQMTAEIDTLMLQKKVISKI